MIIYQNNNAWNLFQFCIGGLLLLTTITHGQYTCEKTWTKVLETSNTGAELFGTKADLIAAINNGAAIRLYIGALNYATKIESAVIVRGEVCTQAIWHVSKASWDTFQSNVYWWFLYQVCTTGHVHISRWYVGIHELVSESEITETVTWFVRDFGNSSTSSGEPIYCNQEGGTTARGSIQTLLQFIRHGADVHIVMPTSQIAISTFSNIGYNDTLVAGQSLWNVQNPTNTYWMFLILSTDGTREMSRWRVGSHTNLGHDSTIQFMDWFVDPCWTLAYKHDKNGNSIEGSLNFLSSAIRYGHRAKLVIDGYSIEADNLQIKNGDVSGQFLGHVSKNTIKFFEDDVYWYWQLISTTGQAETVSYFVGNTTLRGGNSENIAASWYIDSRAWTHVLSTSSTGVVTYGSKTTLVNAIKDGAVLRYSINFPGETLAIQADNVNIQGSEVGAQALRVVSYTSDTVRRFKPNPYWWFTIVSTQGNIRMSRWTVGAHVDRGANTSRAPVDWFVSY